MHHFTVLLRCLSQVLTAPCKRVQCFSCVHSFVTVTVYQYTWFFLHTKLYTLKELWTLKLMISLPENSHFSKWVSVVWTLKWNWFVAWICSSCFLKDWGGMYTVSVIFCTTPSSHMISHHISTPRGWGVSGDHCVLAALAILRTGPYTQCIMGLVDLSHPESGAEEIFKCLLLRM